MAATSHPEPIWNWRNESGLTTLEWLLIVAAVAGLAALAVVLVQNVVDETAEEIGGSNARLTAAQVAAARITSDARADLPKTVVANSGNTTDKSTGKYTVTDAEKQQEAVNSDYSSKCDRLEITYSDIEVDSKWWKASPATSASGTARGTLSNEASTPNGDHDDDTNPDTPSADKKEALCEIKTTS